MVVVRVGGDHIVDVPEAERVRKVGIEERAASGRAAVDQHGFAVAQNHGGVALTDVEEMDLEPVVCTKARDRAAGQANRQYQA